MSKLLAEFQLENGRPSFIERGEKKHYRIRLFLKDAPPDAVTVTYQLDDTYKNPIRLIPAGDPAFTEYTTSYGDYPVQVAVRRKSNPNAIEFLTGEKLSNALKDNYAESSDPAIHEAIQELAAH